jgi:hypothetical protein
MDRNVTRRDFIKVSAGAVACVSLSPLLFGCGSSGMQGGDMGSKQTDDIVGGDTGSLRTHAINYTDSQY